MVFISEKNKYIKVLRTLPPIIKLRLDVASHMGTKMGQKGPVAQKLLNKYIAKVPNSVTNKMERVKEAKKLFDSDTQANREKHFNAAMKEWKEGRKKKK